jgi:site-specific recombinase XerD
MRLFITTSTSASDLAEAVGAIDVDGFDRSRVGAALSAARHFRPVHGRPFVLNDDGTYATDINSFLSGLPLGYTSDGIPTGKTTHSRETWRAIGNDIVGFGNWLADERDSDLWQADANDAHLYHEARRVVRHPDTGAPAVSACTWNRNHASLSRFYAYAVAAGLVPTNPFATVGGFGREVAVRRQRIRFVTLDGFDEWCEIGLRGEHGSDSSRSNRDTRQATRNVVFAQFLVRTGARLTEAASLLLTELPSGRGAAGHTTIPLGSAVTKGGASRDLPLTMAGLRPVAEWIRIERASLVDDAREAGRYASSDFARAVAAPGARLRMSDGRLESLDVIDAESRRGLLVARNPDQPYEPAALWLTEDGLPMTVAAWHSVFRRANRRCDEAGLRVHLTPHMLRHTFAVHMLSLLLAESMRPIRALLARGADSQTVALRRLLVDPIRMLQVMLGHANYNTTLDHYLPYVQQATEVSDAALDRWQSVVGSRLALTEGSR